MRDTGEDRISWLGQVKIYLGKNKRIYKTEKQSKNIISAVIIMLIISMVTGSSMFDTYSDTKSGSFAIISACIWIGIFNGIRCVCRERDVIKREHRTGLRLSSYILARAIFEAKVCAIEGLIVTLSVLIRNFTHLPDSGVALPLPFSMYVTFFLAIYSSDMLAVLVSSIVKDENSAMTVMPFVLIVQLVMSGVVFRLNGIISLISNLTVSRWANNALISIAASKNSVLWEYMFSGESGIEAQASYIVSCWMLMAVFSLIYIFLAILSLRSIDKDQR